MSSDTPLCGGGPEHDQWATRFPNPWPCPECAGIRDGQRQSELAAANAEIARLKEKNALTFDNALHEHARAGQLQIEQDAAIARAIHAESRLAALRAEILTELAQEFDYRANREKALANTKTGVVGFGVTASFAAAYNEAAEYCRSLIKPTECCRSVPCKHPGIGPCDMPAIAPPAQEQGQPNAINTPRCPDGQLPDGPVCPSCGKRRGPSGIDGGTWVHYPEQGQPNDQPRHSYPEAAKYAKEMDLPTGFPDAAINSAEQERGQPIKGNNDE